MRAWCELALAAALAAAVLGGRASGEDDPATAARLAYVDGKFREGDGIIARAPAEVQNDADLRVALADLAVKICATRTGEERREPLFSARQHYAKAVELKPADPHAATGLLAASKELVDLDVLGRKSDEAREEAKFAIDNAEKAREAGVATPEFKEALGRIYAVRASLLKSMKEVELLVSDSDKGAKLLEEAANGDRAGALLSAASALRLAEANKIHEGIPVETEKRDDEAMAAALDLSTRSCKLAGANDKDFATQLAALRLAHQWGMTGLPKPFMQPLAPPFSVLKLEIPKAPGWTREKPTPDWDLLFTRNVHEEKNDGSVQIMIKQWKSSESALGGRWASFADMVPRQFEKDKGDFSSVASSVEPAPLSAAKNAPEVWYYEVAGQDAKSSRQRRTGSLTWFGDKKKDVVFQMKLIDWRPVTDLAEPDLVAFVASAIGEGLWPKGSAPAPAPTPDPKKPPTKKK